MSLGKHIWHPYTSIELVEADSLPVIVRGDSCYIIDNKGKRYLDGISSWWCVNLGHGNKRIIDAIRDQSLLLQHSILGGMSHEPVIELSYELASILPKELTKYFFASDGSSAVECAIRIALQYRCNKNQKEKKKFISLKDGYHGDTLGCVSVGYVEKFHHQLRGLTMDVKFADSPHCAKCPFNKHPSTCDAECFSSMKKLIEDCGTETTAVIVEPLCQGSAGMRIYSPKYLKKLREECNKHDILLISDEIAVGLGRLGDVLSCNIAGILPDIAILGKGLSGGYLPISVVATTINIYNSFSNENTFYYGHTFSGNPIACKASTTALKIYQEMNLFTGAKDLYLAMQEFSKKLSKRLPHSFANHLGAIVAVEVHDDDGGESLVANIVKESLQQGLFIRPLSRVLYLAPPLIIQKDDLHFAFDVILSAIDKFKIYNTK